MMDKWSATTAIAGQTATLDAAIVQAAQLLGHGQNPIIAGLGTDDAGVRASVDLARSLRATIGHDAGAAALRDLNVMRSAGWIVTTPLQTRVRADLVLLVGDGVAEAWPDIVHDLALSEAPPGHPDRRRSLIGLGAGSLSTLAGLHEFGGGAGHLAALRALVSQRRVSSAYDALRECSELLRGARYGVAIWSTEHVDEMTIEMVCGLIDDLNTTTRFAGLPISPGYNAAGAIAACASETGFPTHVSFASGEALHDPWRFDPRRMAESHETDAALWVSTLGADVPGWISHVPTVAVVTTDTQFERAPAICITVGRPGLDHAAILHEPRVGGLTHVDPVTPASALTAAGIVSRIRAAVAASC